MFTLGQLVQHRTGGPAWTVDELGEETVVCSRIKVGEKVEETFQITSMKPYEAPPRPPYSGPDHF